MISIVRLIRLPNLLIVAFTQYVVYYQLLIPYFKAVGVPPILNTFYFGLLVLTTMLIAAGGYIINDLVDYKIDLVNKPHKVFIHQYISPKQAWHLYYGSIVLGLLLSIAVGVYSQNLHLLWIYPLAVGLLYAYSTYLKRRPLMGNVVVGLFCAFVPLIVLVAEWDAFFLQELTNVAPFYKTVSLFMGYVLFAFYTTLLREVVKDVEDMKGDLMAGCRTLPLVFGMKITKVWAAFLTLNVLGGLALFWVYAQKERWTIAGIYLLLLLVAPTLYILVQLFRAKTKQDYTHLSWVIKGLMLFGLLYLFLI